MLYDSLKEFTRAIRDFKTKHPEAVLKVKDVPAQLKIGFEAVVDSQDCETEWTLPISRFKKEATDVLTVNEFEAIKKFLSLRVEYDKAETDYINAFTGVVFNTKGAENAQEVKNALEALKRYAKILGEE